MAWLPRGRGQDLLEDVKMFVDIIGIIWTFHLTQAFKYVGSFV